jgi:hypothetical protein
MTALSQSTRRKLSLVEQLPVPLPEILSQKRGESTSGILLSLADPCAAKGVERALASRASLTNSVGDRVKPTPSKR